MKKTLLLLMLIILTVSIINAQNQGYSWTFGSAPPFTSVPAITGSPESYQLITLGDGDAAITQGTDNPSLGTSCTGPIGVGNYPVPAMQFGLEFTNAAPQIVSNVYTIEMTVSFAPTGNFHRVLGFTDVAGANGDFAIYISPDGAGPNDNRIVFYKPILPQLVYLNDPVLSDPINPNTWYHLAFVRDASKIIRIYLNGQYQGFYDDTDDEFLPLSGEGNVINFFKDDATEEVAGSIAKLSIYNRVLTESEIANRTFNNVCNTTHLLPPDPKEGYQWEFTGTTPFVSTPAVAASLGTYNLATISPGGAMTTGTTEDPALGTSCTTPVPIGVYPTDAGVVFDNSPRYVYNTYTLEMVVNITNLGGIYRRLVGFTSLSAVPDGDYGIYVNLGADVEFYNAGGGTPITGAPLTTGTWYHLVFVRDAAGLISYYQNGVLVGTFPDVLNDFIPQGANDNDITFLKDDGGEESAGRIRKVGIFNVPLPAADVLERFNNICNTALVVLPVSLKSFTAIKADNQVQLTWTTALEENNLGFEVQRSNDGITYTTVGFVKGNGTSSQDNTYYFTDPSPLPGNNYYRLKQIDITNFATFSTIRRINMDKIRQDLQLFPNPARGSITITNIKAGDLLSIFNTHGNLIIRRTASSGQESVSVEKLAAGVYVLQVTDKENSKRIIRFTKF